MGPGGAGQQGEPGPQGPIGPQGVQGVIGPQGPIGNTGAQGPIGNTGPAGPQGPIGNTGPAGPQGPAGDVTGAVRFDQAQALTAPQALQARQNIFAAPIDGMVENNLVVNGSFGVAQQYGAAAVTFNGAGSIFFWVSDQWQTLQNSAVAMNTQWGASSHPAGYATGFGGQVNTANAAPGATDYLMHLTIIEGSRTARLQWGTPAAWPAVLGFWVSSSTPGVYCVTIRDINPVTQTYSATYTINAANTWEYKSIVIPGCTAGTNWANGLSIIFPLMCGSSYRIPPNAWQAGNFVSANNAINWAATAGVGFNVTGVFLLPGNDAPASDRAPLLMRSIGNELLMCERWFRYFASLRLYGAIAGTALNSVTFPAMRKVPAVTYVNTSYTNGSAVATNAVTVNSLALQWQVTATAVSYLITDVLLDARSIP
jgi:hypothetical protein